MVVPCSPSSSVVHVDGVAYHTSANQQHLVLRGVLLDDILPGGEFHHPRRRFHRLKEELPAEHVVSARSSLC